MTDHPVATLSNWRQHPHNVWGFTHVDTLLPVDTIATADPLALETGEALDLGQVRHSWQGAQANVAEGLAATHTDGFLVLHNGRIAAETYLNQQAETRHIVFSVSKSISGTLAGILADRGLLDPNAPVIHYVPEVAGSAYEDCTVRHVLDMTVSINFVEDYLDPKGDVARYRVAMGWNPLGEIKATSGIHGFIATLPRAAHPHGEAFHYVSPNSDMLGWIIERAAKQRFATLLSDLIWKPARMEHDAFITVDTQGAPRTAGGICTSLRDLARFGEMMRQMGRCNGQQIVPERWVSDILHNGDAAAWQRGSMASFDPKGRYRSKWYVPEPDSSVLYAVGIHGQWIYIDYKAGMVAVKHSSQPIPADLDMDTRTVAMFRALAETLR